MTEPAARSADHSAPASRPPAPASPESAAASAPEARPAVPPGEKVKVRAEADLKVFKAGDTVFYSLDGVSWKTGKADVPPVKKRGVILLTVDGEEVELGVAPYRVESLWGKEIKIGDKEFTVEDVYPATNGEPLYDLVTRDPADTKRGVDQETVKNWKSGGDKKEGIKENIAESQEMVEAEIERLLAEVKRVQGAAASELVKPLMKLEQKVLDMEKALAETGEDEASLKAAGKAVKDLRREVEVEIIAMERRIIAVLGEQRKPRAAVEPIKLEAEKEELEHKATNLETRAYELGREDIKQEIVNAVGDVVHRAHIKGIASAEEVVDAWHALGAIEIKLARAAVEKKKPAGSVERAEHKGLVDLPQAVVKEMLFANPSDLEAAMREAYAVLYTPESATTKLVESLRIFFRNIDIDAGGEKKLTLRQQLKQHGIADWESLVKRAEGHWAEKLAGILLEAAKTESRTLLSQKIGDIKKLAGDKRTWGEFVKDNIVDYSALSKMKGAMALRYLTNTVLIGGAGVAAGFGVNHIPLLSHFTVGKKAAIVGGIVGLVKGVTQRFMGKDSNYFQEQAKRAKAEADAEKKKLIADTLIKRAFRTKDDGSVSIIMATELSHFLAASLRRATEEDTRALEFTDAAGAFKLTGDAVCMYHEALRRAAENEGLEVAEKTKLEFARALHAMHNNKKAVVATPPALATALNWLTESYAGRAAVPKGEEGKKEGETARVGGWRQLGITMALGAGVGYAALADGAAVRVGIGAAYGLARGQKAQFEADQRAADRESRANLEAVAVDVSEILSKGSEAAPEDRALVKDYRDIFAALLSGGTAALPEGRKLKNFGEENARLIGWFMAHSKDAAGFLQRDDKMRKILESVQREISRSGFLERQNTELKTNFSDALASMKSANERLGKEAKNSRWVETKRFFKRGVRSVVYGAIGAGVSYGIGKGVEALKHHLAPPVENVAPKPKGATEAAPVPVAVRVTTAPPAPVEFPPRSVVKAEDGITFPIVRQLEDRFKVDVGNNHTPAVTLSDDSTYSLNKGESLHHFAKRVSVEMAKLQGDINVRTGTEHRLVEVGGHVVLKEHDGKFSYEIHGENTYEHKANYLHQSNTQEIDKLPSGRLPEEVSGAPLQPETLMGGGIHPLGEASLIDQLQNPVSGQTLPGGVDLTPHSVPVTPGSSAGGVSGGIEQVMSNLHEQTVHQTAFHDWAMSDPDVQHYVAAGVISGDQLEELTQEWGKTHPAQALDSSHGDFLSAVKLKAVETPPPTNAADEAEVVPPASTASKVEITGKPVVEEAAPTHQAVEMPVAETVVATADHPVAFEPQGNDRVVHFFDQNDHKEHTTTISETLSPQASGDEHNPLSVKLSASGRPIPVRLEMRSFPGKLDKEPVIVFEDKVLDEEVIYRVIDKKLEKIEFPPTS